MNEDLNSVRDNLLRLVRAWDTITIQSRWKLVEEVESLEAECIEAALLPRNHCPTNLGGILKAAFDILAHAHHQRVLPRDIPAIESLLAVTGGKEEGALRTFDEYWKSVNFAEREDEANNFWFAQNGT